MDSNKEIICKRCGKCCFRYFADKPAEKCPHLFFFKNKSFCLVYPSRARYCWLRKDSPFDYPDCPFNTDKPMPYSL